MNTLKTVWEGLGNIVFLLFLIGIILTWFSQRNKQRFFGLNNKRKYVQVYPSVIYVEEYGSVMKKDGKKTRFAGPAVCQSDLEFIAPLIQLFRHPFQRYFSQEFLDESSIFNNRISRSLFSGGPLMQSCLESDPNSITSKLKNTSTIVALGSHCTNIATWYFLKKPENKQLTSFQFMGLEESIADRVLNTTNEKEYEKGKNNAHDYAVVERVVFPNNGGKTSVFIIAGIESVGTGEALNYLIQNWEKIHRRIGGRTDTSFAICIKITKTETETSVNLASPNGQPLYSSEVIDTVPEDLLAKLNKRWFLWSGALQKLRDM